jgi:hypothetical protein
MAAHGRRRSRPGRPAGGELRIRRPAARTELNRHLVLHSREHLPPGCAERYGAEIDWSWAFVLDALPRERTRLVVLSRCRLEPRWVAAGHVGLVVPADLVMSRQMMRGVRARAESTMPAEIIDLR